MAKELTSPGGTGCGDLEKIGGLGLRHISSAVVSAGFCSAWPGSNCTTAASSIGSQLCFFLHEKTNDTV